jgi:hypothetical protein
MTRLFALLLCVFAFASLALAMVRHQEAIFGQALPVAGSHGLRAAGWAALLVALWLIVADQGWALGLVDYSGSTSVAAGIVYGALIVRERWIADR